MLMPFWRVSSSSEKRELQQQRYSSSLKTNESNSTSILKEFILTYTVYEL